MKNNITKLALATAVGAVIGFVALPGAQAQLIISPTTLYAYYDPNPSDLSDSAIATDLGITSAALGPDLFDAGAGRTGTLQSSYTATSYMDYPVLITYNSPDPVAAATYLAIKDGNDGTYIFNLGSTGVHPLDWNGTQTIEILDLFTNNNGMFKGNGDISHFDIYGGTQQSQAVPEASTIMAGALMLLPLGIGAIRALRRERSARIS